LLPKTPKPHNNQFKNSSTMPYAKQLYSCKKLTKLASALVFSNFSISTSYF